MRELLIFLEGHIEVWTRELEQSDDVDVKKKKP